MAKPVSRLTTEQTARIPEFRDRWLRHGLSTSATDRKEAERGVNLAYQAAGLEPPKLKIWLDSPYAGAIGAAMLESKKFPSVRAQVWAQVGDQVRDQVGDQVWAQVRAQVGDQVGDQVRDQVSKAAYGQHDAGWLGFYEFFSEVCDLESSKRLAGMTLIAKSAGWWWPFRGAVILTERPRFLHRDERGRLHNESHKAIEYPDGWGFYAIHGIRVPADIIERPQDLTAERVKSERNAELRRIMMQKLGFDRYVSEIGAKLISTDEVGKLWRVEDEAPFHLAEVINSTPEPDGSVKTYFLPMPDRNDLTGKQMKSCREAIAWSFGLHASEYRPNVQT